MCTLGLNDEEGFNAGIIRGGMSCQSRLFVAQMQDYLEMCIRDRATRWSCVKFRPATTRFSAAR